MSWILLGLKLYLGYVIGSILVTMTFFSLFFLVLAAWSLLRKIK